MHEQTRLVHASVTPCQMCGFRNIPRTCREKRFSPYGQKNTRPSIEARGARLPVPCCLTWLPGPCRPLHPPKAITWQVAFCFTTSRQGTGNVRSEEHTSELQSHVNL